MAKRMTIALSDEASRRLDAYCEMAGVTKGGCIGMLICQNLPAVRAPNAAGATEIGPEVGEQVEEVEAIVEPISQGTHEPVEAEEDWPFDLNFEEEA